MLLVIRGGDKKRATPHLFRYFCVSFRILCESKWLVAIFLAWDTIELIFSASSHVSFSSCLCCLSRSRLERKSWPVSDSWRTFSIFSIFFLASCQEKITTHLYWPFNIIFFHLAPPPMPASWTQFLNPYVLSLYHNGQVSLWAILREYFISHTILEYSTL